MLDRASAVRVCSSLVLLLAAPPLAAAPPLR
jgi:hypothetical protein